MACPVFVIYKIVIKDWNSVLVLSFNISPQYEAHHTHRESEHPLVQGWARFTSVWAGKIPNNPDQVTTQHT